MSTYGMSAKDRLALYQKKSGTEDTKKTGPKKIGKLNIGGPASKKEPAQKEPAKKPAPKPAPKPAVKKHEPTSGAVSEEPKAEVKKEEPKVESKKELPKVDVKEAKSYGKVEPKKLDVKKEPAKPEPKTETAKVASKKEPAITEAKKEPAKVESKKEPAKTEPKKVPAKQEPKKEAAKPEPKKEPAKSVTFTEPAKPEPKKETAKPEQKKEPAKQALKKEPAIPEPKKEPAKPESKKEPAKTEPAKPEPKKEPAKPEPRKEPAKPEPKKEPAKPEPKKELAKPEPKTEQAKPEPKKEPTKPEPKKEPVKPEPKTELQKPEPKKEVAKPQPEKEPSKPEPKKEPAKPEPKIEPGTPKAQEVQQKIAVVPNQREELKFQEAPKGTITVSSPASVDSTLTVHVDTDLDLDSELEANIDMVSDVESEKQVKTGDGQRGKEAKSLEVKQEVKEQAITEENKPDEKKAIEKKQNLEAVKQESLPVITVKKEEKIEYEVKEIKAAEKVAVMEPKIQEIKTTKPKVEDVKAPAIQEETKKPNMNEISVTEEKKKTPMPAVVDEEPIQIVHVERKVQPKTSDETEKNEPLPEVVSVIESVPGLEAQTDTKKQVPAEVVEEIIEAIPAKKAESTPAAPASTPASAPVETAKPKPDVKTIKPMQMFKPSGDDFYNTIFYFSGMGSVVGSSLSRGIYVPDRLAKTSLDVDIVEQLENYKPVEMKRRQSVVESARHQAVDLSDDLKNLRALLFGLPSWGDSSNEGQLDPDSLRKIGGEAPQQMVKPLSQPPQHPPWKHQPHQGLSLINQANMAMSKTMPPPRTAPVARPSAPLSVARPAAPPQSVARPAAPPQSVARPAAPLQSVARPVAPPQHIVRTPPQPMFQAKPPSPPPQPRPAHPQQQQRPSPSPIQVSAPQSASPMTQPLQLSPLPSSMASSMQMSPRPMFKASSPKPPQFSPQPAYKPSPGPPPPPPTSAPAMPFADPLSLASAAKDAASRRLNEQPVNGDPKAGVNMYGVFSGDLTGASNKPWQERYGNINTRDASAAQPFHSGIAVEPRDLKPWQASRLRGLEARGYEFRRAPTKTGADYGGDAFCGAKATIELQKEDDIGSYTPYLVSGKTKSMDMKKLLSEHVPQPAVSSYGFTPIHTGGGEQQLPYCDL